MSPRWPTSYSWQHPFGPNQDSKQPVKERIKSQKGDSPCSICPPRCTKTVIPSFISNQKILSEWKIPSKGLFFVNRSLLVLRTSQRAGAKVWHPLETRFWVGPADAASNHVPLRSRARPWSPAGTTVAGHLWPTPPRSGSHLFCPPSSFWFHWGLSLLDMGGRPETIRMGGGATEGLFFYE